MSRRLTDLNCKGTPCRAALLHSLRSPWNRLRWALPDPGTCRLYQHERPAAVALWGLIVAAGLVFGALTLFVGLAVVMPVLGHATWRLYRRAVERAAQIELPVEQGRAGIRPRQNLGSLNKTIRNAGDQRTAVASGERRRTTGLARRSVKPRVPGEERDA